MEILGGVRGKFKIILVIVIALLILGLVLSLTFFTKKVCNNLECFQESMKSCSKTVFLNDLEEASWKYTINGRAGSSCLVNVELMQAKKGDLGLDKLAGTDMSCIIPSSSTDYPEKDLSKCHGLLKEKIQEIVIDRLKSQIIANLGKIKDGLSEV